MKNQIKCPNCKGYKTNNIRDSILAGALVGGIMLSFFLLITIIGIVLIPIVILVCIGFVVSAYKTDKNKWRCRNCGNKWVLPKVPARKEI